MPNRNRFSQYLLPQSWFDIFCYYDWKCILLFFTCLSSIYTLAIAIMVSKANKFPSDCKGVKESYVWLALAKILGFLKVVLIVQTVISLLYYFLHNLRKPLPFVTLGIPGAKVIWVFWRNNELRSKFGKCEWLFGGLCIDIYCIKFHHRCLQSKSRKEI